MQRRRSWLARAWAVFNRLAVGEELLVAQSLGGLKVGMHIPLVLNEHDAVELIEVFPGLLEELVSL